MSSFASGPEQFKRLLAACAFYQKRGYRYSEAPWAVDEEAMCITRPFHYRNLPTMSYRVNYHSNEGMVMCPVASGEQSFLHDQLHNEFKLMGRYVTLTPCFRNEEVIDALHRPYFMKVELIDWTDTTTEGLNKMIHDALKFFRDRGLPCKIVKNIDPDPIAIHQPYDIVSKKGHVELGSYGIREHSKVGRWVYGTGCAEPRLSQALDIEDSFAS